MSVLKLLALVCLAVLLSACGNYDPFYASTSDPEGVWALDNGTTRRGSDEPILKRLEVYATHMELSPGQGKVGVQGEWRTDGFWCQAKDGSGEIEGAKVLNEDEIELHLAAFYAGNKEVLVLHKVSGNQAEIAAQAAQYPSTITYPPPKGAITLGMSEYRLSALPWRADQILVSPDDDRANGDAVFCYHSDDPNLLELRVTVKDQKVINLNGGHE